jgi:hypothetical protein
MNTKYKSWLHLTKPDTLDKGEMEVAAFEKRLRVSTNPNAED